MAIYLVRHTTPDVAEGTCYGNTDLEVADTFLSEAAKVDLNLPTVDSIVTSPLIRCKRLAAYLAEKRQLSVRIEPRLIEMDFGRWEGQLWDAIPREQLEQWSDDFMHARSHGGESVHMLQSRVRAAISELDFDSNVAVISHSGVIKVAFARGETAEHFKTDVSFGEVVEIATGTTDWLPDE